jgi:glutamine amidotransferase
MQIGVINHGVGNSVAIINLLRKIGANACLISTSNEFVELESTLQKLIIPGVGSFDAGMMAIREKNLEIGIQKFFQAGKDILGICLGMQLMMEGSEEGNTPGLGLIPGTSKLMPSSKEFRVPHVGWTEVNLRSEDPLFHGVTKSRFYHNHSYAVESPNRFEIARIEYAGASRVVAVRKDRAIGVQFHPEKSHSSGEQLIRNFISK